MIFFLIPALICAAYTCAIVLRAAFIHAQTSEDDAHERPYGDVIQVPSIHSPSITEGAQPNHV